MSPVPAVPVKNTRNAAAQINSTKEPRGTKTSGLCFLYGNKETGEVEEMNYEIDVHTHTVASGHAYSTLQEMVRAAKEKGLKGLGITEHAPLMPGSCQEIYFRNLRVVPREIDGLRLLLGVELNIRDARGNVDMSESTLRKLDVRIASMHRNIFPPKKKGKVMEAVKGALENPYVDILGHPDDGNYGYDYEELAQWAARYGKIIEINNASLRPTGIRPNAYENDLKLLKACSRYEIPVMMGSDAHISYDVGACEMAQQVIEEAGYPAELVMNYNMEEFLHILEKHRENWPQ